MKKSVFKKDIHNGIQPIRVLKHNLTTRLINRSEELILSLQSTLKLSKHINYISVNTALSNREMKQTPYIDSQGVIHLHETFLSYAWIMCYSLFVFHEENLVIPDSIKQGITPRKKFDQKIIDDTEDLFSYGKSLWVTFSDWNKTQMPNPEEYDCNSDEGWYIERANDLFVEVVNFILFHEIAHAHYEHIKKIKNEKLNDEAIKNLEIEADTQAVEWMLSDCRSNQMTQASIVIGLAIFIFSSGNVKGGTKHPDLDLRITNVIQSMQINDEHEVWSMLCLILKLWNEQFSIGFDMSGSYDNYADFFRYMLGEYKKTL